MRYEVRRPDGKLIGLYNGPDRMPPQVRLISLPPMNPISVVGLISLPPMNPISVVGDKALKLTEEILVTREVMLVREKMLWGTQDGSVADVPTLVLKSGKRTWLNHVKGFRRI